MHINEAKGVFDAFLARFRMAGKLQEAAELIIKESQALKDKITHKEKLAVEIAKGQEVLADLKGKAKNLQKSSERFHADRKKGMEAEVRKLNDIIAEKKNEIEDLKEKTAAEIERSAGLEKMAAKRLAEWNMKAMKAEKKYERFKAKLADLAKDIEKDTG